MALNPWIHPCLAVSVFLQFTFSVSCSKALDEIYLEIKIEIRQYNYLTTRVEIEKASNLDYQEL